jgi:tetratricopeptide (TPR) repeat protein
LYPGDVIGRNQELGTILDHVDAACGLRHKRNVVFVTGEAGIGKTTVLKSVEEQLSRRSGNAAPLVVATECSTPLLGQDVGQVEALEPWAEILEKILAHDPEPGRAKEMAKLMGSVALAWIHVVPFVGGILESSIETAAIVKEHYGHDAEKSRAASQEQMFQQYINFLAKASEAHPLVLILDDFHWADTSSTNLLFSAARHLAQKRVLFIVAYRADDAASSRDGKGHPLLHVRNELGRYSLFTDVVVPRMTATDLDGLLRARYSRYQGSGEFERWLAERSGGNALFITQYLNTLEEDGIVSEQTGEFKARFDSVRVPTSAFSVVEERIRRLDDDSRELLRYASVEGATFTVSVLSAIADMPRLKLLQKLRLIADTHGVIKSLGKQRLYATESTAYQFTNVLMQRAMYEGLEEEEQDELHAGIFRAIREDFARASDTDSSIVGLAVRLVAHATNPDDRHFAARLLLDAARVSWSRFAEEETLSVLDTLFSNLEALEAARRVSGKPAEHEVRDLEAEGRMLKGLVHKFRGRYHQALEEFRAARGLFEKIEGKEARAVGAMVREAFALENAQEYLEADTRSREALERAERLGEDRAKGAMLNNLGLVLTATGRANEGLEYQRQSLEVRERIGDLVGQAVTLGSTGLGLFSAGRLEEALLHHRRSLELRERLGDRVGQGYSLTNIANTLAASGRLDDALEYYEKSVAVREASADVVGLVASLESEAKVLNQLGRQDAGLERLERALELREALRNRAAEGVALAQLAGLYRDRGDAERSRELYTRALELARREGADERARAIADEFAKLPPAPERAPNSASDATLSAPEAARSRTAEAPSVAHRDSNGRHRTFPVVEWLDRKLELGLRRAIQRFA